MPCTCRAQQHVTQSSPRQVNDLGLQLNSGYFRLNGSCGYVLKPQWLRDPGASLGKVRAVGSG